MKRTNDLYAVGNDYQQFNHFDNESYHDGHFEVLTKSINKRVFNKPQDEWIQTKEGFYFSPDYATTKTGEFFKFTWGTDNNELQQKTDKWLSSLTYYNYDYEWAYKYLKEHYWPIGGCSSVHKGNIRGRNYDWYYDNHPTFLIRTPATNGRHATIGIGAGRDEFDKAYLESGKLGTPFKLLPFRVLDGVNDAGLVVNVNVCQIYDDNGNIDLTNVTNKENPAMPAMMMTRYLLDYCSNIDEVIAFANKTNIFMANSEGFVEEFHYMISDTTGRTIVLEWKDNEPVITDANIMTNFKLCGETGRDYGNGYERRQIVQSMYDDIETAEDMLNVMKTIWYDNAYKSFKEQRDIQWYSECNGKGVWDGKIIDLHQGMPVESYQKIIEKMIEMYDCRSRETAETWQTVHTSIYDMDNKKLSIIVQQDESMRIDVDIEF